MKTLLALLFFIAPDGVIRPGASLYKNLTAVYTLEEASGNRASVYGSANTLTDNNTVASATGKVGTAADFELDTAEFLTIADNADLSTGDIDFSFAVWINMESKAASGANNIIWKFITATNQREYRFIYEQSTDRFQFIVSPNGSLPFVTAQADNLGSPSTATWYFIVFWHDATANEIGIQVNNGTANTTAHTTGVFDGTSAFTLGATNAGANPYDGLMDQVVFAKRIWTADEKTRMYNSGTGVNFPF